MLVEISDDLLKILLMDKGTDLSDDAAVSNAIDIILSEDIDMLAEWGELSDKAESAWEYYKHRWNLEGWEEEEC